MPDLGRSTIHDITRTTAPSQSAGVKTGARYRDVGIAFRQIARHPARIEFRLDHPESGIDLLGVTGQFPADPAYTMEKKVTRDALSRYALLPRFFVRFPPRERSECPLQVPVLVQLAGKVKMMKPTPRRINDAEWSITDRQHGMTVPNGIGRPFGRKGGSRFIQGIGVKLSETGDARMAFPAGCIVKLWHSTFRLPIFSVFRLLVTVFRQP